MNRFPYPINEIKHLLLDMANNPHFHDKDCPKDCEHIWKHHKKELKRLGHTVNIYPVDGKYIVELVKVGQ